MCVLASRPHPSPSVAVALPAGPVRAVPLPTPLLGRSLLTTRLGLLAAFPPTAATAAAPACAATTAALPAPAVLRVVVVIVIRLGADHPALQVAWLEVACGAGGGREGSAVSGVPPRWCATPGPLAPGHP